MVCTHRHTSKPIHRYRDIQYRVYDVYSKVDGNTKRVVSCCFFIGLQWYGSWMLVLCIWLSMTIEGDHLYIILCYINVIERCIGISLVYFRVYFGAESVYLNKANQRPARAVLWQKISERANAIAYGKWTLNIFGWVRLLVLWIGTIGMFKRWPSLYYTYDLMR